MAQDATRVQELFAAALGRDAAERESFVRRAAGADTALAEEVLELLRHESQAGGFLSTPAVDAELARATAHPARIGRYAILRVLGEGGMGVVYLAQQDNPSRSVALKVLRPGAIAPRALRRFEQEAQVLGRLHHPGIAAIHEAGAADSGAGSQPYFAMEFVAGESITEYAEHHALGARERFALIAEVCDAVQHAHERGVVHRDMKPANVLIDTSSGRAQPKVLDFGIARATDSDLATATHLTGVGQLVGTVPYMSPEQAAGERDRIDARSDVYALGVMAYELLTGRLPHDFAGKALHEAVRTIREDEPTPISAHQPVLRGDVETIVQKALEKDPARRFASAAELAADIRRWIADEPVRARPPSALYQMSKFARRHRALVVGTAAVFVALIVGLVGTAWQARIAANERDNATAGWKAEESARVAASAARDHSSRVSAFFQDLLARASPATAGPNARVVDVLDRAARELPGPLLGARGVEVEVRTTLGRTYLNLGRFEAARLQFATALDLETGMDAAAESRRIGLRTYLANALVQLDRIDEAAPLVERALSDLAGSSDPVRRAEIARTAGQLATRRGEMQRAEGILRSAVDELGIDLGARDPAAISLSIALGHVLSNLGRLEEAEQIETAAVESARAVLGIHHPETWVAVNNLACTLQRRGELERALPLFVESDESGTAIQGEEHPETLTRRNNLAGLLNNLGRKEEAAELYARILPALDRVLGSTHVNTLTAESNLGLLLAQQKRFEEAEAVQRDNLERMRRALGNSDARTIGALFNLSWTVGQQRRFEEALELNEECVDIAADSLGDDSWERWHYQSVMGALLEAMKRFEDAIACLEPAAEAFDRILGERHPRAVDTHATLERCRHAAQR